MFYYYIDLICYVLSVLANYFILYYSGKLIIRPSCSYPYVENSCQIYPYRIKCISG